MYVCTYLKKNDHVTEHLEVAGRVRKHISWLGTSIHAIMAEFPEFGNLNLCSQTMCGQFDFLPLECSICKNIYCDRHFKPGKHDCYVRGLSLAEEVSV
jgi:hypothetical protein